MKTFYFDTSLCCFKNIFICMHVCLSMYALVSYGYILRGQKRTAVPLELVTAGHELSDVGS